MKPFFYSTFSPIISIVVGGYWAIILLLPDWHLLALAVGFGLAITARRLAEWRFTENK